MILFAVRTLFALMGVLGFVCGSWAEWQLLATHDPRWLASVVLGYGMLIVGGLAVIKTMRRAR